MMTSTDVKWQTIERIIYRYIFICPYRYKTYDGCRLLWNGKPYR